MSSPQFPLAFEIENEICVPVSALHAFLCDLHNYVPLHPFIESIQDLPPGDPLPNARRYRVVDRIPIGPFFLKTVYTASLVSISASEVHGYAWQSPGIRLHNMYILEKTERGTRLIERCYVDAHWLLRGFVISQARVAHSKTLEEMKVLLEDRDIPFR